MIYAKNVGTQEAIQKTVGSINNFEILQKDDSYGISIIEKRNKEFCSILLNTINMKNGM